MKRWFGILGTAVATSHAEGRIAPDPPLEFMFAQFTQECPRMLLAQREMDLMIE